AAIYRDGGAPGYAGPARDLRGQFVLPGLIDAHVHSWGNMAPGPRLAAFGTKEAGRRMLYAGVTGFLDLFSEENQILRLRDRQRREGLFTADIYCAGPILTCSGGHGTEYGIPTRTVDTPAQARVEVLDLAARRPDVVKLVYDHAPYRMPSMDRPTMQAIIQTADSLGLKTVAHVGSWTDVYEVVQAGVTAFTHLPDGPLPDSVLALLQARRPWIIPTLTVQSDFYHLVSQPELLDRPLLQGVALPGMIDAYRDSNRMEIQLRRWLAYQRAMALDMEASLRRLHQAGLPMLAGTDAGNPGTFHGWSLHRELTLLVAHGLSPWEALAAASTRAGDFLGQPIGLSPGATANLLILGASPIEDIRHTEAITGVVYRGQWVDREALRAGPPATGGP
ncbi:MAG: hypothetical protein D6722_21210, partial [Bacteroidetes bacterium]